MSRPLRVEVAYRQLVGILLFPKAHVSAEVGSTRSSRAASSDKAASLTKDAARFA